jgi:hypothetical protein
VCFLLHLFISHTDSQEYIPVARVEHECVAALIRQVYDLSRNPPNTKRLDTYSSADIEQHLPAYIECKRVFKDWDFLVRIHMLCGCVHCPHACAQVDHGVASMLCDVMQFEDPSKNPYQKVESTRKIGYQEGDQISYTQTRRYMTSFAWLKEFLKDPKSIDVSMQHFVFLNKLHLLDIFCSPPQKTISAFWLTVDILDMRKLSASERSHTSMPALWVSLER